MRYIVPGDTKYQVSILPIPGSRIVVSSTETGIDRYWVLYIMWPRHVLEAESDSESDLYLYALAL